MQRATVRVEPPWSCAGTARRAPGRSTRRRPQISASFKRFFPPVRGPSLLAQHRRDLQLEIELLRHQHSAGFERLVPRHAIGLSVEGAACRKHRPAAAPRVDTRALVDAVKHQLFGDAVNREVTYDANVAVTEVLDARALERDLGE